MVKDKILIILLIFFSLFSVRSLFLQGFPPTHDGEYHIIRFYEFYKALESGVIYPRWAMDLNFGYGVPLFNYVYPLPNYIAAILHFFGFSFINAFKVSMIIATLIGAISFYYWMHEYVDDLYAFAASLIYVFSPYRFLDIFIRGSIGEVWSLSFFPAFLFFVTKAVRYDNKKMYIASSIMLALTILSHNILGLMFSGFGILYVAFLLWQEKRKDYKRTMFTFLLAFGMSAIFWLPALLEKTYVKGLEIYDIGQNFPELYQLLVPSWGSGFSSNELNNQMSYQLGVVNILLVLISLFVLIKLKKGRPLILFFVSLFLIVCFLMLSFSKTVWETFPLISYFQFPWRLLSLSIIISSFLGGFALQFINKKIIAAVIVSIQIIITFQYGIPAYIHQRDDNHYILRSNFINSTNSPGNLFNTVWFKGVSHRSKQRLESSISTSQFTNVTQTPHRLTANVIAKSKDQILVNIAYFPEWNVYLNGKKIKVNKTADGRFSFWLPKNGGFTVDLKFENTPIRHASAIITIVSIMLVIIALQDMRILKYRL